jgi:hypothetical protein
MSQYVSTVAVRLLEPGDVPALDAFLCGTDEATVFHRPEWHEVVRRTYGHHCDYWTAWNGQTLVGVMPAVHMRAPLLGSKVVAMPYQMHSGMPLTSDESVAAALVGACVNRAQELRAKYVEIRHHDASTVLERAGFVSSLSGLVTTSIPLEGLELTRAEHGHRQRVRKAAKQGVEIVQSENIEDLRTFRRMYLETGRAMGAPQAGWPLFQHLHELARSWLRLYLARFEGRIVGGLLLMADNHIMFSRCSAHSSSEALKLNAGPALWWRALTDAAAAGVREFNCGISWVGDPGLIKWKEGWGGPSRPVHVYVKPITAAAPAAGGYFEGFNLAKTLWKKLPLPVVDQVGQRVTRWIG